MWIKSKPYLETCDGFQTFTALLFKDIKCTEKVSSINIHYNIKKKKMQCIMLDPTQSRVSSSYKSYMVLKFLHRAKNSMK